MNELNEFLNFLSECKKEETPKKDISKENIFVEEIFKDKIFESPFKNFKQKDISQEQFIEAITETAEHIEECIIEPPTIDLIQEYANSIKEIQKEPLKEKQIIPENSKELKLLQNKIDSIEKWLMKIPTIGESGGGAGEIYNLDFPVRTVSANTTLNRKDYYVGVNSTNKIYITLPSQVKQGRVLTIKDESGTCSLNSIMILGTIDNDPSGVELRINNGSITLIYNNGWRII